MNSTNNLMRVLLVGMLVLVCGVCLGGSANAELGGSALQPMLVGWEPWKGLVSIDTTTGICTRIMSSSRQIEGLAFDPISKVLYGVDNLVGDNVLVIIDLDTGTITEVGYVGFNEITGMT
ncbi:hypothetical protein ACFLX5_03295 [Chloroflexota bacterium]